MRQKKRRNGREIPAPRGAENPTRRQNFVSGTPTIFHLCAAAKTRTARRRPIPALCADAPEEKMKNAAAATMASSPQNKEQDNFNRTLRVVFFLPAFVRRKKTYRTEPPSPPPRQRMPENNNFARLPTQTGARFVRRPQRKGDDFVRTNGKRKPTLPTFSLC